MVMHFRHHLLIHFGPHLLQVIGRASHFLLRPGSAILQPAVLQAKVKAGPPAAFPCPLTEKGSHRVVPAAFFVARSSLEPALFAFLASALCRYVICPATVDLVIVAVVRFAAVVAFLASDFAATVAAVDPDFVFAADLVCSFDSVCSFAAMATGKGRAVVAISCFLTPRSSS